MDYANYLKKYQEVPFKIFLNALENNKLFHAYLLVGEIGTPLLDVSKFLAASIIDPTSSPFSNLDNIVSEKVMNESYEDLVVLDTKKKPIKIDDIRNLEERFYKTGINKIGKKVYIINCVENLGIDSGIIIIILLILTIFLLVRNISMNMRLSRLERKYKTFMKGSDAQSLEKVFVRKFAQIDKLYDAKEEHDHDLLFIKKNLDKMFNKYGVEKYDAFDDVGGKLSFALALLDKENTGLILNAVHSRDNCFLYMKEIVKGESYVMLSQEEVEALRKAVNFGLDNIEE